jgi:hypothetical protein
LKDFVYSHQADPESTEVHYPVVLAYFLPVKSLSYNYLSFLNNELVHKEIILMHSAPQNAAANVATAKPSNIRATIQNKNAFIISINNPNVAIFKGSVNKITIGRIIALTRPKKSAAINAAAQPDTLIP